MTWKGLDKWKGAKVDRRVFQMAANPPHVKKIKDSKQVPVHPCPECGADMERHVEHPSWPGERVEKEPNYWCPGTMTTHVKPITIYDDGSREDY